MLHPAVFSKCALEAFDFFAQDERGLVAHVVYGLANLIAQFPVLGGQVKVRDLEFGFCHRHGYYVNSEMPLLADPGKMPDSGEPARSGRTWWPDTVLLRPSQDRETVKTCAVLPIALRLGGCSAGNNTVVRVSGKAKA